MSEAENKEILSDSEETTLQELLYEDIRNGKLTTVAEIAKDRDWQMRLVIYRVRQLIESGRVGYAANPDSTILFARNPFPRNPRDEEIDGMKESLLGLKLTGIEAVTDERGDQYTRFVFGDRFYQFLAHFTANDHQVAVAKEALESLAMYDGSPASATAEEALRKMETFKR